MKNATADKAIEIGLTMIDGEGGLSAGIKRDGEDYMALTLTEAKRFATIGGAVRFMAKRGYAPTGTRLAK